MSFLLQSSFLSGFTWQNELAAPCPSPSDFFDTALGTTVRERVDLLWELKIRISELLLL